MNPLDRQIFFKGIRKTLLSSFPKEEVNRIWSEAGEEYIRILSSDPEIRKHKGAMAIPCVAIYRVLSAHGLNAEGILSQYGKALGIRFAGIVHAVTSVPGVDRLIWKRAQILSDRMSSADKGYERRLVSDPPVMYGVDILSCPYHELCKQLGTERAIMCICCIDKEYSQGFRHIRYERNSALPEGADCCEYRLRFDITKK